MSDIVPPLVHLLVALARLTKPGGVRSVVDESVLIRHQLDPESFATAVAKFASLGSLLRRLVCSSHLILSPGPFCNRFEAIDSLELPSSIERAEVLPAVLALREEAGSQRTRP
jgi:hypothetical protein